MSIVHIIEWGGRVKASNDELDRPIVIVNKIYTVDIRYLCVLVFLHPCNSVISDRRLIDKCLNPTYNFTVAFEYFILQCRI